MADESTTTDRGELVISLTTKELDGLSDEQIRVVQRLAIRRNNKRASERVKEALKDRVKDVAKAMTTSPYVYISPEIRIMAGCAVRFSSLMKVQLDDAHRQLDVYVVKENPNDMRMSDMLNVLLLAHTLVAYNGQDFGGVSLDPSDFQGLRATDPEAATKTLETVRDTRMKAVEELSPHVVQRLSEYYQAFQMELEHITQGEEIEEALGN